MFLGCSKLPLFMLCAGSHVDREPEHDRDDEPTVPQATGNATHDALAGYVLFDLFEAEFIEELAEKHKVDSGELGYLFRNGSKGWEGLKPHFPRYLHVEQRVTLNITPEITLTGKADIACRRRAVLDWKSGYRDYDSEWQLQGYGRLWDAMWGFTTWLREQAIDTYRLLTAKEFDAAIIAQVQAYKDGKRVVGDHCQRLYCPKIESCEPYQAHAYHSVSGFVPKVMGHKHPIISRKMLSQAYPLYKEAKAAVARYESYLNDDIDRQGPMPIDGGPTLVREERFIDEIDSALALPVIEGFLSEENVPKVFKIVKGDLQGQVKLTGERGQKSARWRECMDALEAAGAITKKRQLARRELKSE